MSAATEIASRVRVSDPKPDHCSMCFCGPSENVVFFDCGAAFDAGAVINQESQAYVSGSDDLHLCESCVRELTETAGFKPELHGRQLREIRRLELQRDYWRSAEGRAQDEIERLRSYIRDLEAGRDGERQARRGR